MEPPYDFKLREVVEELRKRRVKRVLIQLPDGLKQYHEYIVNYLLEHIDDLEVWVSLSPTYGACDIAVDEARKLNVDIIVHIGHNQYPFYRPEIPVLFVEAYYKWSPHIRILEDLLRSLRNHNCRRIGLLTVIQHVNVIDVVASFLRSNGLKVMIPEPSYKQMVRGQVLGCEYSCALNVVKRVDCYVVVAGGLFHVLGLWLSTRKHVLKLDPYEEKVVVVDRVGEKVLKKRYAKIMQALQAKVMGIIDGSKPGQHRPWLVKLLRDKAREKGLKTRLYITDYLNEERLRNIDSAEIDFYAVTLCPRIPIDDLGDYEKPVLTPGEALMVLEERLDEYKFPW